MNIQPCTVQDVQQLIEISKETFYETFKDDNTKENMDQYLATAFTPEKLTLELETTGSAFFFAYVGGHVAGYLKLNTGAAQSEAMGEEALEVGRIYVQKAFQKHGIGKQLLQHAFDTAKAQHKTTVWLGVWEKNSNAIGFYESKGFRACGQHSFFMGDEEQIDTIMKTTLV